MVRAATVGARAASPSAVAAPAGPEPTITTSRRSMATLLARLDREHERPDNENGMRFRRPSRWETRLIAALGTVAIAASGVGASLYPHTPAAKDCCRKRCDHDAQGGMQRCCCGGVPASPVASPSAPDVKPVVSVALPASVAPIALPAVTPRSLRTLAPPGTPGFLERCTLLL